MNSYTNAFIKRHKVSLIACVSTRFDDYVLRLATSAGPCLDLFPCFNARTAFSLKHRWGIRALSVLGLRVLAPIRPTKQDNSNNSNLKEILKPARICSRGRLFAGPSAALICCGARQGRRKRSFVCSRVADRERFSGITVRKEPDFPANAQTRRANG